MVRSTSAVSASQSTQTINKIPSQPPTRRRRTTNNQSHHLSYSNNIHQDDVAIVSVQSPPSPFPGYRRGNLVCIEMWNFLTFSHTLIRPGPRMNLIIGPNGTGKSTIVNAVCIAFGGSPRLLGRNPDLGAFVKHGTSEARVEVQIYDPSVEGAIVSVKRVFDSDGRGYFSLDGKKITMKELHTKVNRIYDVQLDNLSQFMPQEKIAEFVNIKPDELLTITVRSLGGAEKEELLQELINVDEAFSNETTGLNQHKAKLNELKERQAQEAEEVDAYRQQQQVRDKLDLYRKFLPHLEQVELKEAYIQLLQQRKNVESQLAELENELKSVSTGPINQCKHALEVAVETFRTAKHSSSVHDQTAGDYLQKADDLSIRLVEKQKELNQLEHKAQKLERDIKLHRNKLEVAQDELIKDENEIDDHHLNNQQRKFQDERNHFRNQIMSTEQERAPLEHRIQDARRSIKYHDQRLRAIGNERQRRIEMLSNRPGGRNLKEVDRFVQQLKHEGHFRGNVYGPVAAEIEVNGRYHARIMEASVAGFLNTAFVTENARDSRFLIAESKKAFNGWAPDIITAPTTRNDELDHEAINAQVPPRGLDNRLESLGLLCPISDIYRAPLAVRAALNAQASLHTIFVGDERSEEYKDELRNEHGVHCWFTPTSRCQVVRSKYDSNVRTLKVETQFANVKGNFYSGSVEEAEKEKEHLKGLIRKAEDEMTRCSDSLRSLEEDIQNLKAKVHETEKRIHSVAERRNHRKKRRNMVESLARNVQHLERVARERKPEVVREALVADVIRMEHEAIQTAPKVATAVKKLRDSLARLDELMLKRICAERELAMEESKYSTMQDEIRNKSEEREMVRQEAREAKNVWKTKQQEARRSISDDELQDHEDLFTEIQQHDATWLSNQIAELTGQLQGLNTGGQSMLDAFEHRAKKIEKLRQDIEMMEREQSNRLEKLQTRKQDFLKWLDEGVNKMRKKFSSLYRRLGCSGDLQLVGTESARLSELSLQILVSYRDGVDLRPISATANSGGEKMCCTMLFCFSLLLEEERMPPFVMVDELNQGLDPTNEMKIMTMMFEDAEMECAPQSFVITPKLLLNLPFHSRTKTHIIFNGKVTGKLDVTAPQE